MEKILSLIILPVYAQNGETVDIGAGVSGFFGFQCILEFVFRVVDVALIVSGIALLVYLVWGGLEWLVSGGDKTKVQNAQSRLTNALIGVAIIAASYAAWRVALTFFGIDLSNVCGPNPVG